MLGIGIATLGKIHSSSIELIPAAPTDIAATVAGNIAANVTWTDAVTGLYYLVYQNTGNDFTTASAVGFALQGVQELVATGLTPGQQYWFWVVTVNAVYNTSDPGGPATATMGNLAEVEIKNESNPVDLDKVESIRVFNTDIVEKTRVLNVDKVESTRSFYSNEGEYEDV